MNITPKKEFVPVRKNFNSGIEKIAITGIVHLFGENKIYNNEQELKQLTIFNDIKINNRFYWGKDIHKYTWSKSPYTYNRLYHYKLKLSPLLQDVRVHRRNDIRKDHFSIINLNS